MNRIIKIALVVVLVFIVFGQMLPSEAAATATGTYLGCDAFRVEGTTDAPYVMLSMYNLIDNISWYEIFPMSGATSFELEITYPLQDPDDLIFFTVSGMTANDRYAFDGGPATILLATCTMPMPAPTLPSDYVLRTMLCDVPVYNTPGGTPVGDGRVLAGQTFFVSPTPVDAPDGTSWTRIFVSSYINPYIPTQCVGGAP